MKISIKKDRNLWKNRYNINRKSSNRTTFSRTDNNKKKVKNVNSVKINKKRTKVVDSVNNTNLTLIIGFSKFGKTYLKFLILFQKQEPIFITTKSKNSIVISKFKHQMNLNHFEIMKTALFFVTICCYRNKKAILFCFLLEVEIKMLIFAIFLRANLISQKILSVIILV